MCYGFFIAYLFTGNAGESAGIVFLTGSTLTLLQWFFEIFWDKYARGRIRHALSGQHGRIGRLVWLGRSPRTVSLDEHESRSIDRQEETNPLSPENAGREWT
jgi:uncharacterized membrane protein